MEALENSLRPMGMTLRQRAEMNPLSILAMGMRRPDSWTPAVMAVLGLFDHLCYSSAEARQAAIDLGFQPLIPLTKNKEGKVCLKCSDTSLQADIKSLQEKVDMSNFYLRQICHVLQQVAIEGGAIRVRSEN
jgi:hypothetical protein